MLNDRETAQYTHTLNVTATGDYRCTVANTASSDSATITVEMKTHCLCFSATILQLPHLPVMRQQSRMVPLVSECPGLHPVMPLATGSTIPAVEETVVVRMSVEDTLTATL